MATVLRPGGATRAPSNSQDFPRGGADFATVALPAALENRDSFSVGLRFPQAPGTRMNFDFWFPFRYRRGYWSMPVLQEKPPEVEESVAT